MNQTPQSANQDGKRLVRVWFAPWRCHIAGSAFGLSGKGIAKSMARTSLNRRRLNNSLVWDASRPTASALARIRNGKYLINNFIGPVLVASRILIYKNDWKQKVKVDICNSYYNH
jgi:hypothetical protein